MYLTRGGRSFKVVGVRPLPSVEAHYKSVMSMESLSGTHDMGRLFPILCKWGLTSAPAGCVGGLVFTDSTTTRFWLVEPGEAVDPEDAPALDVSDRMAIAHQHADVLYCLVTYLGFAPRFVRFFVAGATGKVPGDFCVRGTDGTVSSARIVHCSRGKFDEVCAQQYAPSLSLLQMHQVRSELLPWHGASFTCIALSMQVDSTIAGNENGLLVSDLRKSACGDVDASGDAIHRAMLKTVCCRPRVGPASPHELTLACLTLPSYVPRCALRGCLSDTTANRSGVGVSLCERCRCVYYCSPTCQRAHWAEHKVGCRGPRGIGMPSAPSDEP